MVVLFSWQLLFEAMVNIYSHEILQNFTAKVVKNVALGSTSPVLQQGLVNILPHLMPKSLCHCPFYYK